MFLTKNKELALELTKHNYNLQTIRDLAQQELNNNTFRNCNFERYIIEEINTFERLEQFIKELKEQEQEVTLISVSDKEYASMGEWNNSNIRLSGNNKYYTYKDNGNGTIELLEPISEMEVWK